MNKTFLASVMAIVLTLVIGFSLAYLLKLNAHETVNDSQQESIAQQAQPQEIKAEKNPYAPPSIDQAPLGEEGDLIRLGYKEHTETSKVLDGYVTNKLSCGSCHANGGVGSSIDLVGVTKTYPQYNSRAGKIITLQERINGCFKRSMNGKPLPVDSKEMKAFMAYYAYISQNVPDGTKERPWAKIPKIEGDLTKVDVNQGREIYNKACITCHGQEGAGTAAAPPVSGNASYNIGAGMGRVRTAAGFIKGYMPKAPMGGYTPGSLTNEEALAVAKYINSLPRPDFPEKIYDWPKGDAPDDAAYETLAGKKKQPTK
ncbi:c-type cytochrome [Bacillota bacterium Lsc_1132]